MEKNFFCCIFWGPAGRYIKSIGTGDTKMSANADLITVETYVHKGKQLFIFGGSWGGGGAYVEPRVTKFLGQ